MACCEKMKTFFMDESAPWTDVNQAYTLGKGNFAHLMKHTITLRNADGGGEEEEVEVVLKIPLATQKHSEDLLANEYRMLLHLSHPAIRQLKAMTTVKFNVRTQEALALELVTCMDLQRFVFLLDQVNRSLTKTELLLMAKQLLSVLSYLQSRGILHRAINPSNVIVNAYGGLKLIDFKFACKAQEATTSVEIGHTEKTCRAPELSQGLPHTFATEIFAVGALLYYIFTGTALCDANPPLENDATIDPEVRHIIQQMVAKQPNLRALVDNLRTEKCLASAQITQARRMEATAEIESFRSSLRFCDLQAQGYVIDLNREIQEDEESRIYHAVSQADDNFAAKFTVWEEFNEEFKTMALHGTALQEGLQHRRILSVVETYEFEQENTLIWCTINELFCGKPLSAVMEALKRAGAWFSEEEILLIAAQLVDLAAYLEEERVLNRFITPSKILIDECGNIKLADFNSADRLNADGKVDGAFGMPGYVAPEVLAENYATAKSDLFSIACILYELATRTPLFPEAETSAKVVAIKNFDYTKVKKPTITATLSDLLTKMLKTTPSDRPKAKDVKRDAYFKEVNWEELKESYREIRTFSRLIHIFENF